MQFFNLYRQWDKGWDKIDDDCYEKWDFGDVYEYDIRNQEGF